ncbi:hypothetical protein D3C83_104320 [compost metagenome]
MWRAAIWSTVTPPNGAWLCRGCSHDSHVAGTIACTAELSAGLLPRPLTTVMCFFSGANGARIGFKSKSRPAASGVQRFISAPKRVLFMIAPCGR